MNTDKSTKSTTRRFILNETRTTAQPELNNGREQSFGHQSHTKIGYPMVGTPWPELEPEDLSIEVNFERRFRMRVHASKWMLVFLILLSVLMYGALTHDKESVSKFIGHLTRVLRE